MARVLGVLSLIQSRGRWNAKAIADELGVSERTVYRDLEVLEFAGVPWYFDERELCYRLRSDIRFPTLALTDDEAWGQVMATALSKAPGLAVGVGAGPTTRKLAATSKLATQQLLADAAKLVDVFNLQLADHSQHQETIKIVQQSLLERKCLTGIYDSPHETASRKLHLHPYRLCLIKAAWYVVGRIDREELTKTFRIARFKSLRLLEAAADIPVEFSLCEYFGNAWAVFRGDQAYDIELRFVPKAARLVTETVWHHSQRAKTHRDGSVSLRFTVDGLDEILNWLLAWAGRVEVRQPAELKRRFVDKLQLAIKQNSNGGTAEIA
jgi:predicted DNA-binding transcriptional regulator YafY